MNIWNLVFKGAIKYLESHPDKVEQLVSSAIQSLIVVVIQKLAEHHAANTVLVPAPAVVAVAK